MCTCYVDVGQCQSDSSGGECAHVMWMWDSVNQIAVVMSVHMLMYRHTEIQQTVRFTADVHICVFTARGKTLNVVRYGDENNKST